MGSKRANKGRRTERNRTKQNSTVVRENDATPTHNQLSESCPFARESTLSDLFIDLSRTRLTGILTWSDNSFVKGDPTLVQHFLYEYRYKQPWLMQLSSESTCRTKGKGERDGTNRRGCVQSYRWLIVVATFYGSFQTSGTAFHRGTSVLCVVEERRDKRKGPGQVYTGREAGPTAAELKRTGTFGAECSFAENRFFFIFFFFFCFFFFSRPSTPSSR